MTGDQVSEWRKAAGAQRSRSGRVSPSERVCSLLHNNEGGIYENPFSDLFACSRKPDFGIIPKTRFQTTSSNHIIPRTPIAGKPSSATCTTAAARTPPGIAHVLDLVHGDRDGSKQGAHRR